MTAHLKGLIFAPMFPGENLLLVCMEDWQWTSFASLQECDVTKHEDCRISTGSIPNYYMMDVFPTLSWFISPGRH